MQEKKCAKCKKNKSLNDFNKNKTNKDGLRYNCRTCNIEISKNYRRTPNGLASRIYSHQKEHSKTRGHKPPNYTKNAFKKWLFSNKSFFKLFNDWIKSDYNKTMTPSVDRLKDSLPYSLENIQLTTWWKNNDKGLSDMRLGKLTHGNKPQKAVIQFNKHEKIIGEYISTNQASRMTGVSQPCISMACNGILKSSGGFKWKFKN